MFLVTFGFEHKSSGATQMMLICNCKSYKIDNQMFFNIMFSFSKTKDEPVVIYIKIQLFSSTILRSASNELDAYLEFRLGCKYASMNITLHLAFFRKT